MAKKDLVPIRIQELRDKINNAQFLYYQKDAPVISDQEYDELFRELLKLESARPDLVVPDSPTQRVGGAPQEGFEKIEHEQAMLSLDNVFDEDELRKFDKRIRGWLSKQEVEYIVEPKLDGLAIELTYENSILVTAATRGDGSVGENVTHTIKTIKSIPLGFGGSNNSKIRVRGEAIISKKEFAEVNKERERQGKPLFANPRNAASGAVRQLDPRQAAERKLKFFAYDLFLTSSEIKEQSDKAIVSMYTLQIPTVPQYKCTGIDEVIQSVQDINTKRKTLPYEVDGSVIKVNSLQHQQQLGFTGRVPRWAIAFKFQAEQATTMIKDIIIQVGRTGSLTPVAILDPVQVGGVTVERATLHNQDQLDAKNINIGDKVIIQRAGDVIPEVVKVSEKNSTGVFQIPDYCPVCGAPAVQEKDQAVKRCTSLTCPAKLVEYLKHAVSRDALNIDGLGSKIVEQLVEAGVINKLPDIFKLHPINLITLEGFKDKKATKLVESIQKAKYTTLDRFIYCLGIPLVGKAMSELIAKYFSFNLEAIMQATIKDLLKIDTVGPEVAKSIVGFFNNQENTDQIKELLEYIRFDEPEIVTEAGSDKLKGLTFVVSGTHQTDREELKELIKLHGGKVSGSVSRKTSVLLAGESAGPKKLDASKEFNIPIWNELELRNRIN